MRFVKLLREGRGVWGVLHGDVVRTLTEPPFEGVRYDGALYDKEIFAGRRAFIGRTSHGKGVQ